MRNIIRSAIIFAASWVSAPVSAALVCEADLVPLDFGSISVRDGIIPQTSGPVTISCTGGMPGTSARACLRIGPGSGGSGPGQSPRYLTGDGTAPLDYQLTSQNTFSGGGPTWETVAFTISLDANGSAIVSPTIYAEVTSIGSRATIGGYSSRFETGPDIEFTFGETACDQLGAASTFSVGATVTASCTVSVSNMDFGAIDSPVVAPVDQTASILVSCTNASAYTVGLGQGLHSVDSSPSGRRMENGGNLLAYGLYADPSRTSDWALTAGTVVGGIGTGGNQSLTVYGRILADQQAVVGTYSDTVVVIVSY